MTDTPASPPTTAAEFARAWPVLLAALVGFGFGLSALPFYTAGIFVRPLAAEFGWQPGAIMGALATMTVGTVLMWPLIGWATDKFGAKPVALVSLLLYIPAFATIGVQTNADIRSFYLAWLLMSVAGAGTVATTWTRAINGWFDNGRGLALGLALCGSGLTGAFAPALAELAIENYGWRHAYLALALLPLVGALPLVIFLFRDPPRSTGGADGNGKAALAGLSVGQSLATPQFWIMLVAFFLISVGVGALIPNIAPILIKDGVAPMQAAQLAGVIGLSVIGGRILAGFLIDRIWAPLVAFAFLIVPAISCVILANPQIGLIYVAVAAALIGAAAGAEFDLIAFLCSRYFGMKDYAKVYGLQFIGFGIGAGFSPPIPGMVLAQSGSYEPALFAIAGLFVIGASMLLLLGRYRFKAAHG